MTDEVQLSPNETVRSYPEAGVVEKAARSKGFVVASGNEHYASYMGLSGAPLEAFDASWSPSSHNVTIHTGEGYVQGKWVGRDTDTTVTLSGNTNDQDVYVGWPADTGGSVIIGTEGDFPTEHGKLLTWTFDTDTSGVTNATDRRVFGPEGLVQPDAHIPLVAMHDGDTAEVRVPVPGGATISVTGWGARTTNNDTPAGLDVELVDPSGTVIRSDNTAWHTDPNGFVSHTNTGSSTIWMSLRVSNGTGTDYVDPDGITADFAYEVEY